MAYGLCYKLPFKDLKDQDYTVEIEKNGYTGVVTELTGSDTPFTISIDDEDFLYTPLRFSTAKIGIVGSDYLQDLFSTQYQMFRVTLLKGSEPVWCGFIKPENYSQDYVLSLFSYEVECVSAMSVMENLDYKQVREGEMGLISLWDILKNIITRSQARFRNVYVPHVYAKDEAAYEAGDNVLAEMTISEQNFFDENGKAMTCKDVLEAVCYFLNWTCVDWQGSLYFIDIDHTGDYYKYISDLSSFEMADINSATVQDEGFNGDGHTLDILGGYNKVTVKDSNYPAGDLLQQYNFDSLKILKGPDDYTTQPDTPRPVIDKDKPWQYARAILYYPDDKQNWIVKQFTKDGQDIPKDYDLKEHINEIQGALPAKVCMYENKTDVIGKDPYTITTYSYDSVFLIRQRHTDQSNSIFTKDVPLITIKSAPFLFKDGCIGISGSIKPIYNNYFMPWNNVEDMVDPDFSNFYLNKVSFPIRISVKMDGMYYYGSDRTATKNWVNEEHILDWGTDGTDDRKVNSYLNLYNMAQLSLNVDGLSGFAITPFTDRALYGRLEFTLYAPNIPAYFKQGHEGKYPVPFGLSLKDLNIKYYKRLTDDGTKNSDSDRVYENVINENYINELDEIEFKVSSYNNDGSCYSKVLFDNDYLQDNLYNVLTINKRPEELLITRIINRYDHTSIKLTQEINFTGHIQPFTRMKDEYAPMAGKTFIPTGGEIDVAARRYKCIMIEL